MSQIDTFGTLAFREAMSRLDVLMKERGVSIESRDDIKNCAALLFEYIAYAQRQSRDPTDRKVLVKFLDTKSRGTLKLLGNDSINCGLSIIDLLITARHANAATASGLLPVAVTAWGLAVLDLIEVGNSCSFVQQGFYELFLKQHTIELQRHRERVRHHYQIHGEAQLTGPT